MGRTWEHCYGETGRTWEHCYGETGMTWEHCYGETGRTWEHCYGETGRTWEHCYGFLLWGDGEDVGALGAVGGGSRPLSKWGLLCLLLQQ